LCFSQGEFKNINKNFLGKVHVKTKCKKVEGKKLVPCHVFPSVCFNRVFGRFSERRAQNHHEPLKTFPQNQTKNLRSQKVLKKSRQAGASLFFPIDPWLMAYGVEFFSALSSCATSTTSADRLGLRVLNGGALCPIIYHLAPTFRSERPQEAGSHLTGPPTCCTSIPIPL
jgi:hypothetical protein